MRRYLGVESGEETLIKILKETWADLAERHFDSEGINLMAAHLFMNSASELIPEEEPEGEKSILHPGGLELVPSSILPRSCQYMALGHLHRPFPVQTEAGPGRLRRQPRRLQPVGKSGTEGRGYHRNGAGEAGGIPLSAPLLSLAPAQKDIHLCR